MSSATVPTSIRLTPTEKRKIAAAARKRGLSPAAYIKRAALDGTVPAATNDIMGGDGGGGRGGQRDGVKLRARGAVLQAAAAAVTTATAAANGRRRGGGGGSGGADSLADGLKLCVTR